MTGSQINALRGKLLELQTLTDSELIATGPAGTGKSIGVLHKLHTLAEGHANLRILMLRKTRESLTESGMATFENKVVPAGHPILFGARGQDLKRRNRSSYDYDNGSSIVCGGMDNATKLFSTDYDVIYVQECNELSLDEWEKLLRALRNNKLEYQQLIGDCNPDVPHHWIQQRKEAKLLRLLETRHEDNPLLYDLDARAWTPFGTAYIATLDKLTGVRKDRLRYGRWVAAEGMVYEGFDKTVHVIPRFRIPDSWRKFRAIDFGYTNPFVCQWWAMDGDGTLYLYREIYKTKTLVSDHAKVILEHSAGERIEFTVADHDAEDRATLEALGIPTRAAKKSLSPGIQAFENRFKIKPNGKAGIYFLEDSLLEADQALVNASKPYHTAMEIPEYVYPSGANGKPVKEVPVKLHDHGVDPARYLVMEFDDAQDETGEGWYA